MGDREPDLCVIGASEAGRTAAIGAVALGLSVTMVDPGGDRDGLRNPDVALEVLRISGRTHIATGQLNAPFNFAAFKRRLSHALRAAAAERRLDRLAAMNIRVIRAAGAFSDPNTVIAAGQAIRSWRTIIATGGRPATPDSVGSQHPCFTLHDIDRLEAVPSRLVVLGGGGNALAAAQAFGRFGAGVIVVTTVPLPGVDPEIASPLLRRLASDGVSLVEGSVEAIELLADGIAVRMQDGAMVVGSHLLDARDKGPALDGLDLDRAMIGHDPKGLLLTPAQRTTNRRVYAIGRPGGASSTVAGIAQATIALRAGFLRMPVRFYADAVATVTATDPQVATIGASEEAARNLGPVKVVRWPLGETNAGFAAGAREGHIKVVTDRRGRILGVGIVGEEVRDLVPFWALAINRKLSLADLGDVQVPSPSWSEASRRLLLTDAAGRLKAPWLKRLLGFSRRIG